MQASEQRFRLAFDDSLIGMALVDVTSSAGGRLLRVNRSLSRLIGYSGVELVGADLASLTHADDRAATVDALEQLSSGTLGTWQTERRFRHADGHDLWCRVVMSAVHAENGDVDYCVAQLEDISIAKRAEHRNVAEPDALHDSRTGLASRGVVLEHLTAALARAARTDRHAALLYVDVDRFAEINDGLGRAIGDELLAAIGRRLGSCLRDGDVGGHVGGDAFAVVCSDLPDPQEVAAVAERIEEGLNALFLIRDHPLAVTVSTGIAISAGRTSAPDLMHEAVGAMYRAKEGGRGRYEIADPALQARAHRQTTVEAQLRDALDRDELVLHYQPVFDLRSERLVAVEALLRWRHPRRGLLRPSEFLDVAEGRDLIVPVGEHVLELACTQGAKWLAEHPEDAPELWVNVSARQLGKQRFAEQLGRRLDETGLPPAKITIELAERQLPTDTESAHVDLRRLPELGVHLAIDDFGTGHAGMDYLRRLPLDTLKIDRSYVGGLGTDRTRTAMTSSMITLAKSLDLTVVAEGVETTEQRVELIELGCDLAQGYLLGHPQPAESIDELLSAGAVARPS
jgi:diguanylate cyclase (GGDEF)-like protein/PAS domain S-box-containing protein